MLVDDIVKIRAFLDVDGVSCQNAWWIKVLAVPATDSVPTSLSKLVQQWFAAFSVHIASSVTLSCASWQNVTRNEDAVAYPGVGGGTSADHHPSFSVLNIHCEAWDDLAGPPRTVGKLRNSISGWIEGFSTRGRVSNPGNLAALETYYSTQQLTDVGELSYRLHARHDSAGKAWRDGGKVGPQPAPVYVYLPIQQAQHDRRFRTLASRQFSTCV